MVYGKHYFTHLHVLVIVPSHLSRNFAMVDNPNYESADLHHTRLHSHTLNTAEVDQSSGIYCVIADVKSVSAMKKVGLESTSSIPDDEEGKYITTGLGHVDATANDGCRDSNKY